MFISRPLKRATNSGVRMRMKPASTTKSGCALSIARQILIEGLSRRVALVVDQRRFNTRILSNTETAGAQAIADHQRDLATQGSLEACVQQ